MTIGEIIRERRIELEISQDELAKMAGYTNRSSIARIESGEIDLPYSKFLLITKALDLDPLVFFSDDEYQKYRQTVALFNKLTPKQRDLAVQLAQSVASEGNE